MGGSGSGRKKKPVELKIYEQTYRADRDADKVVPTDFQIKDGLPDPPKHLHAGFDKVATDWYNFLGLSCVNYGIIDFIDIAQLSLCAMLYSDAVKCQKKAAAVYKVMTQVEKDYDFIKQNYLYEGDLRKMDVLLREVNSKRQIFKMLTAQENLKRNQANSIASSFGANPVDRMKLSIKPQTEEPEGDILDL